MQGFAAGEGMPRAALPTRRSDAILPNVIRRCCQRPIRQSETRRNVEYLHGGREGQIARSGALVHRPAGFWSPSVHLLLNHLRQVGFCAAPEPRGFDDDVNEVLTFVAGDVSNYPYSQAATSPEALETAAKLLRSYHDASASFLRSGVEGLSWMLPSRDPAEVICHGDYAPYNVVLNGRSAVAIIDFDTAHPGPRTWDVAYALYRWSPLHSPDNPDGWGDLANQIQRAKRFCDAYGLPNSDRTTIIDSAIARLQALVDFMSRRSRSRQ